MTPSAEAPQPSPGEPLVDLAERVADRVLAAPGVSELHGGMFGEVATYLPGRRLMGVRVDSEHVDVHVVMEWGHDVRELATGVRSAVAEVAPDHQVSVTVEDVAAPVQRGSSDGNG